MAYRVTKAVLLFLICIGLCSFCFCRHSIPYQIRSYEFKKSYYFIVDINSISVNSAKNTKVCVNSSCLSVFYDDNFELAIDIDNAQILRKQVLYNNNKAKTSIIVHISHYNDSDPVTYVARHKISSKDSNVTETDIFLFSDDPTYREKCALSKMYIFVILFFALAGGLLLNFMPCCLPILSIKIYNILSGKMSKLDAIYYVIGSCATFMTIAIYTLCTRSLWGSLMQNTSFVSVMLVLFFLSAMHFFDILCIVRKKIIICASAATLLLLAIMEHKIAIYIYRLCIMCTLCLVFYYARLVIAKCGSCAKYSKNRIAENIFQGAVSSVNATICTGPVIGTAICAGLAMDWYIGVLIFFMIALGFVAPVLIITILPFCRKAIPKPGEWLVTFKKLNGIAMLAACIWLMQVVAKQTNISIVFTMAFVMLTLSAACLLLKSRHTVIQIIASVFMCCSIYYLCCPLKLIIVHNDFEIYEYSHELMMKNINNGQKVLLTFTSDFCLNCKYNHSFFKNKDVMDFLAKRGIVVMKCDITKQNDEFEKLMESLGISSIPYNILFISSDKRNVLPEILTKSILRKKKYWA